MPRLTKYIGKTAHGAEGTSEFTLTGKYCRGEFESTAIVEKLAKYENIADNPKDVVSRKEVQELVDRAEQEFQGFGDKCTIHLVTNFIRNNISGYSSSF